MIKNFFQMKNQKDFKNYGQFFVNAEAITNAMYDLNSLQRDILSLLFPTAQPLLQKVITYNSMDDRDFF